MQVNNKTFKKYLITSLIGVDVTICLLYSFGFFGNELGAADAMKMLSDSFTVTGIVLLAVGAMVYVSTQGMFDSVSYMGKFVGRALIPGKRNAPLEKYGDYKVAKSEHRFTGYGFLPIVGLCFTVIGVIFTLLFFIF